MKIKRLLLAPALIFAIVLNGAFLSFADNANAVPASNGDYVAGEETFDLLDTPLSVGIRILAYERPMIVSGKSGENIGFSAEAFNDYAGYVPSSVTVLSLPAPDSGTLMHGDTPVGIGEKISVLTLASLCFKPSGASDAEFTFTADNTTAMRCIVRQRDIENKCPQAIFEDSVSAYTSLDTVVGGYLTGADPDGDTIEFEIVDYPEKGLLSLENESTGAYAYTPYKGVYGNDSFTYRIRDSYGAYSEIYKTSVIVDNTKATVYNDMNDSYYTSAVNDVVLNEIMQTQKTADGEYFDPYVPVSRIDFLIMAMKAAGAGKAEEVTSTQFADDGTLTPEEKGYLSAAYRLGIVKGSITDGNLSFMPDEGVTGAAAAVMLNGILGLTEDGSIPTSVMYGEVPAWAASSVTALTEAGIIDRHCAPVDSVLTREDTAVILSRLIRVLS